MKGMFFRSLLWKISAIVIVIESLILTLLGIYYTNRFSLEIDKRIETQVQLPGILMNRQLLAYKSVSNKNIMTELVGEEFVDGIVFGTDKKVFYALNDEYEGKGIMNIPEMNPDWIDNEKTETKIIKISGQRDTFLVSMTPLVAYEGAGPFFFVYIKVNTNRSEAQKTAIASFFIAGSVFCVVLTSLLIIAFMQTLITRPLGHLERDANQLAQGHLERNIETTRQDELGSLARSFGQMRDAIRQKIGQLEELNQTLEHKVNRRTLELQHSVERLQQEIAERKRAEAEARQAKESAETANQAKSTFLANMSHELRTPLNAILGFAQIMARNPNMPPEEQENLGIIQRNGDHLLTLINQVLDLSKIEVGRITLNEKKFDLLRLLDDLNDMFSLKARTKGLQLVLDRAVDVPRCVCTDEVKLRQVLINLLNNAMKFTEVGGVTLRIATCEMRNEPTPVPSQEGTSKIQNLKFEIGDTGPGIAPEEMDNLFEAFVQTETGRQAQEGTGLGLSLSRKFVQLMGGDITAKSELGHGTTFMFDIQVGVVDTKECDKKWSTRHVIALEPGQPRYRLLIADDKPDNRKVLVKFLSPFDFECREASNGREAIEIWEQWKPHLIWMDMHMPVLDGYEATKRITHEELRMKDEGLERKTIIIAVTASSFEEERAVVLSAGCDDFLRKPFKEAEIFEMLSQHLGVRFVYKEETQSTIDKVLTPEALAALSAEWLGTLEKSAERADILLLSKVIEQIREHDAVLAGALAQLADNFEYDEILALLPQTGQNVSS